MERVKRNSELKRMYYNYKSLCNNPYKDLVDVYFNFSIYKSRAFDYCMKLVNEYNKDYTGNELYGIISYNCMQFTYGFLGIKDNEVCFFYITKKYDKYASLSDMVKAMSDNNEKQ